MKLQLSLILIVLASMLSSCGGGGGGESAGQQSVLRIVNATQDSRSLDVRIDEQLVFTDVQLGEATIFEAVQVGARLVGITETGNLQRSLELQNEFAFATPYTILTFGSGQQLTPIVAVNDRSDTAAAQFRIRAINASERAPSVLVRLVAGQVGIIPIPVTPTAVTPSPTAQPSATATQNSEPTAAPPVNVDLSSNLSLGEVGAYSSVPRGDYRIEVESAGSIVARSGVISFSGGQVVTVVIRDSSSEESGSVQIMRLDDRP